MGKHYYIPVADPDQPFVGDSQIRGRQKGIHLFKPKAVLEIIGCYTKVVTRRPRKWLYF